MARVVRLFAHAGTMLIRKAACSKATYRRRGRWDSGVACDLLYLEQPAAAGCQESDKTGQVVSAFDVREFGQIALSHRSHGVVEPPGSGSCIRPLHHLGEASDDCAL
jgi:hypothetical protein